MTQSQFEFDYLLRVVMVGDPGIGKSSLLVRYVDQQFSQTHLPTIGIDFKTKIIQQQGKNIKLQFWDTAGQERFRIICRNYYRGAHAIFIVYDITDRETFKNFEFWINEINQNSPIDAIKVLIGNKSDLEHKRQVKFSEGQEKANEYGFEFFEVSALSNKNIDNAINHVTQLWITKKELDNKQLKETQKVNQVLSESLVSRKKISQLCQC